MSKWIKIGPLLVMLLFASCETWLDVNDNPNSPPAVPYENVLPSGITSIMYVMGGRYQVLGALWSQHWTQSLGASQYSGIDSYDINSSSFDDNQFGELYTGALKAFEFIRQESAKEEQWNYYLIATVMQSYTFQVLVDLYDEIPFSEALAGEMDNLTPHYEKGQDVYDSLIVRLDEALSHDFDKDDLLQAGDNDVLFEGDDIDPWIEFANTLKLKLFLRQSEARPDVARAGIEQLYADEAEFISEDVAFIYFQNQSGQRNPLYETEIISFGGNPNLVLSKTLHNYLIDNNDDHRLNYMFSTAQSGSGHKSLIQGNYNDPEEPAGTNSSSYSKPIMLPNTPVYLMSYTEACFLQAEAIMRYNVESYAEAKENYNAGLTAAYYRLLEISDLTSEEKESLIESAVNDWYRFTTEGSPVEDFIEQIIVQKWVSLAGIQSLETFFEHNRTHYPATTVLPIDDIEDDQLYFTVSVNNVTSGRFPKRLLFPESEYSSNPNTPALKPVWEKVWWDTKPESE